jgi:hypothetical protein
MFIKKNAKCLVSIKLIQNLCNINIIKDIKEYSFDPNSMYSTN